MSENLLFQGFAFQHICMGKPRAISILKTVLNYFFWFVLTLMKMTATEAIKNLVHNIEFTRLVT